MMKRIFLLLISSMLLFSCSKDEAVSTVGSIYGVVSDAVNGEPIRNVSVTLSPSNLTTATGSDGHYEFIDLPEGQYKVQCTSAKYQTNSRQITVLPGKSVSCDFQLSAIVVDQTLDISSSSLNFGTTQTEMSVTIVNKGTEATEWTVDLGNHNWLSANPKSGRIAAGKSQTIVFTVNRERVTEDKSVVVNIAAFGNTYPISISCTLKKNKGELTVEPASLDFGQVSSEKTITLKNVGDASLNWTISNVASPLSVSEKAGELVAGGIKVINVRLDRTNMSDDINTSIIVSDGEHDKKISIVAQKTKYSSQLELSYTEINFGLTDTELPLIIKNSGNADLNWEIKDIMDDCISVASLKGSLTPDATFKVMVKLDRSKMPSPLSTTITVTDGSNDIKVAVKAEKGQSSLGFVGLGEGGSGIDFGEDKSEFTFYVVNMEGATANLRWEIDPAYHDWLTVTPTSGEVLPEDYIAITVKLNRAAMTSDLDTTIDLYDLDDDEYYYPIPVKAKQVVVEDYSKVIISTDECYNFSFKVTSCKRKGSNVTIDYLMTNNSSHNTEWDIFLTSRSFANDDKYNSYTGANSFSGQLAGKYSQSNGFIYDVIVGGKQTVKGSVTIKNVDATAKMITLLHFEGIMWDDYEEEYYDPTIEFKNVPIY